MSDLELVAVLAECERQTGGVVHGWDLVFHINGPGGKSSGAVTLKVCYSNDNVRYHYWTRTVRQADHAAVPPLAPEAR